MKRAGSKPAPATVGDIGKAMERIAPHGLAQSWDNVGVLLGDLRAAVRRTVLCIDLTPEVADELIEHKSDMVICYHPPIFRPIKHLRVPSSGTDEAVLRCARAGAAIYATHTALDAAEGGTNDVLIGLCGIEVAAPLEYVDRPGTAEFKLVAFVPHSAVDAVAEAVFAAGAGRIGNYSHCGFRIPGTGTFLGDESTKPVIGQSGRLETVDEIRLEAVVPSSQLADVVHALRASHPYEEPAFDLYPLKPRPVRGIGRVGDLPQPATLAELARRLIKTTASPCPQIVGAEDSRVTRVIAVAGAAGDLPFRAGLRSGDVVVTGELRHHDALAIARAGATAIALGHWTSERPVLSPLAKRLGELLPQVEFHVSERDCEPIAALRRGR